MCLLLLFRQDPKSSYPFIAVTEIFYGREIRTHTILTIEVFTAVLYNNYGKQSERRGTVSKNQNIAALFFVLGLFAIIYGLIAYHQESSAVNITPVQREQANFTLSYPQLQGVFHQDAKNQLNQRINQEVQDFVNRYSRSDNKGQVSYEVEFNRQHMVSITLKQSFYMEKAAHPMKFLKALTMNVNTGQIYQLSDLFVENSNYPERLNTIMQEQITNHKISMFQFPPFQGIQPEQEFYLTAEYLVVYYQIYEHTPYAYGFLRFPIPYNKIQDILKTEFVVSP